MHIRLVPCFYQAKCDLPLSWSDTQAVSVPVRESHHRVMLQGVDGIHIMRTMGTKSIRFFIHLYFLSLYIYVKNWFLRFSTFYQIQMQVQVKVIVPVNYT